MTREEFQKQVSDRFQDTDSGFGNMTQRELILLQIASNFYETQVKTITDIKQVKTITDIKQGDTLIVTGDTLKNEPVKAQIVKVTPNDGTEIIFDKKMNRFFNLGMYLEGKSWVKDVRIII